MVPAPDAEICLRYRRCDLRATAARRSSMAGVAAHGSATPGAGQERFCGSEVALHCLEGQVSLIHHVMAFEEANGGRKILSDTQRWKAQFAAYFLGAVPGAASLAGADDQQHGWRGLRLAKQLGRQDQQKALL